MSDKTTQMGAQAVHQQSDCLFTHEQVETAISTMAKRLDDLLQDRDVLVLTVMNGGLIFAGKLLTQMQTALRYDYIHASRYRGDTQGHELQWIRQPEYALQGQTVLLLDDILDRGWTLEALVDWCRQQGADEVLSAVLVEKHHPHERAEFQADVVGLTVPDRYVYGYGMDYHGHLRNADGIYAVRGL